MQAQPPGRSALAEIECIGGNGIRFEERGQTCRLNIGQREIQAWIRKDGEVLSHGYRRLVDLADIHYLALSHDTGRKNAQPTNKCKKIAKWMRAFCGRCCVNSHVISLFSSRYEFLLPGPIAPGT